MNNRNQQGQNQGQQGRGRGGRGRGNQGFGYGPEGFEVQSRGGQPGFGRHWQNTPQGGVSFRGMGPKGYKRSDERIREEVQDILADHHRIDARLIEVAVKDGEVTLSGTVNDVNQKYLIDRVLNQVPGVQQVLNTIRVSRLETTDDMQNAGQGGGTRLQGKEARPHAS